MTEYVNLHKEITAIGAEVTKLKESNAHVDALTQAKDASLRAFMVEQKAEIDHKFHEHDVSLQATISSGRDEFQRLHQVLGRRVTGGETRASEGGGKGAGSEFRVNSVLDHETRNSRLCRRRAASSSLRSGGTTA